MSKYEFFDRVYIITVSAACILLFTTGSYMITLIQSEYHPIIISTGIPALFMVIALIHEKMMVLLQDAVDGDRKKDDDAVISDAADDADEEEAAPEGQLEGILYEVDMNDLIDMIVDKLQDKMQNRITTVNADDLRDMLKTGYRAMSSDTINADMIELIVDMVLSCIDVMNIAWSEHETASASAEVSDEEAPGEDADADDYEAATELKPLTIPDPIPEPLLESPSSAAGKSKAD